MKLVIELFTLATIVVLSYTILASIYPKWKRSRRRENYPLNMRELYAEETESSSDIKLIRGMRSFERRAKKFLWRLARWFDD